MVGKKRFVRLAVAAVASVALLSGCNGDSDDNAAPSSNNNKTTTNALSQLSSSQIASADGALSANIRYTAGGVPHIYAANLASAGFGSGYVQAKANVCVLADQILRVTGERAKFYGPGPSVSPPVPAMVAGTNVVSDFSMKALGLVQKAQSHFGSISPASQAMLKGFAAGYNYYVDKEFVSASAAGRHGKCAGQPWVRDITAQQLFAYYYLVSLYASGMQFVTGPTFFAGPGPLPSAFPQIVSTTGNVQKMAKKGLMLANLNLPIRKDFTHLDMGSNGWGLGGNLTKSGRGALLANPHFPYTGSRRLFQLQITVPGVYDVNGGALLGVAIPLIGFNNKVAWTHTVSTANHFTFYALQLKAGNPLVYIKDGKEHQITKKTIKIKVANGSPTPTTLEKDFYYSEYGPMLNVSLISGQLPKWGQPFGAKTSTAFTYRDANIKAAGQVVDQWLQMGMAQNLSQFKQAFKGCSSVLWVNTIYADADGNAFYIDGTSVPNLSKTTIQALGQRMAANPLVNGLYSKGVTVLDGSTSRDDWIEGQCGMGIVHYKGMPKLERSDYVQNSNDSYWATNLSSLNAMAQSGYSPLYGPVDNPLSPRTRMGLKMVTHPSDAGLSTVKPAGPDGKFDQKDIIDMLYSNRAYYAEMMLDDLQSRCTAIGTTPVNAASGARTVNQGCAALSGWDGVFNKDSVGAAVFRAFIGHYDNDLPQAFSVHFDPDHPATTPRQPVAANANLADDAMLKALADGLTALDAAGISYNAKLGDVQFVQQSKAVLPGGTPQVAGAPIPWGGTQNIGGGFNIVRPYIGALADGTRFPRVSPLTSDVIPNTGSLAKAHAGVGPGWQVAFGTSWHFGLMFTDNGPKACGLLSYSQSVDSGSAHFEDQDKRFSNKKCRPLYYAEKDVVQHTKNQVNIAGTLGQ